MLRWPSTTLPHLCGGNLCFCAFRFCREENRKGHGLKFKTIRGLVHRTSLIILVSLRRLLVHHPQFFSFVIQSFRTYPTYLKGPGVNSRGGRWCQGLKSFSRGSQQTTRRNSLVLTTETQREMVIGSAPQRRKSLNRPGSSYPGAEFHTLGCLLISGHCAFCKPWPREKLLSQTMLERGYKLSLAWALDCIQPKVIWVKENLLVNTDNLVKMTLETEI